MPSHSLAALVRCAALLSVAGTASAAACRSCDATKAPVCGSDGLPYLNKCVATCQDIHVASAGACDGDSLFGDDSASVSRAEAAMPASIGKETMNKFADEGFTYQGPATIHADDYVPQKPVLHKLPEEAPASSDDDDTMLTLLSDGHIYGRAKGNKPQSHQHNNNNKKDFKRAHSKGDEEAAAVLAAALADARPAAVAAANVSDAADAARRLIVFGNDARVKTSSTTAYPYRVIGLISILNSAGSIVGYCSGALVSPHTILTAGHCAYDGGAYYAGWKFAPGATGTYKPYGEYSVISAVTCNSWRSGGGAASSNGNYDYDMALLKISSAVGNTVGYLGIGTACSQSGLRTAGYPGDRFVNGHPVQVNEGMDTYYRSCSSTSAWYNKEYTRTDIYFGQSGSPVYSASYQATAVVSFSIVGSNYVANAQYPGVYNGFNVMRPLKSTRRSRRPSRRRKCSQKRVETPMRRSL